MARHDYNILNQLFPATRQDLNNLFVAIHSNNSGAGTPSATVAYMRYVDTSLSEILMRNAADTGSISLRKTTGEVIAPLGSVTGASYSFGSDFNTGMFSPGANIIGFTNAGVERVRIDAAGKVGIGTSSPLAKLDVTSSTAGYTARFGRFDNNGLFLHSEAASTHYNWRLTTQTAVGAGFEIAPSTAVGGTTWASPVFALRENHQHSIGTTSVYNSCVLTITQPIAGQSSRLLAIQSPVATSSYAVQFVNPNGRIGTITTSGTSTAYNTSSDYRLKENIKPIDNILDRFKKLKPCSFNFLSDKKTIVDGFLAHEVQEVIPEAVTGVKDEMDEDGTPKYQGIDQAKIVPLLVASVQELIKKIEALEK